MPSQGYERVRRLSQSICALHPPLTTNTGLQVAAHDQDDSSPTSLSAQPWPPASPPPSFHSRASSPSNPSRRLLSDSDAHDQDRTLADTFDSDSDDDEDGDGRDDRQRLMRGNPQPSDDDDDDDAPTPRLQRRVTDLPVFDTQAPTSGRVYGGGNGGVWANLSAKPTRGEDAEEKPPVRLRRLPSRYCTHTHADYALLTTCLDIRTSRG